MKILLIVDDQIENLNVLTKTFEKKFEIVKASTGEQALLTLKEEKLNICAILLNLTLPGMDGMQTLINIKSLKMLRFVPVIIIASERNSDTEQKALTEGALDFIYIPFVPHVVFRRVQNLVDLYQYKNQLEKTLMEQTRIVKQQSIELSNINEKLLNALGTMIEFRDVDSGEHIHRMKIMTRILSEKVMETCPEYELTEKKINYIVSATMLHDIGKIAIRDSILNKPGKLTKDEFDIMKTHTTRGCDIIDRIKLDSNADFAKFCYDICRYHHERFDGNGYPEGLTGDDIPIAAQIVSITDVYDALISDRVYKQGYAPKKAYNMIIEGECGLFNPKVLKCFQLVWNDFETALSETE